jgi:diguanylate cyclase (GGDEF)-like protein
MAKTSTFLKNVDIFSLLDPAEVENIVGYFHPLDVEKDQILFREGEEGRQLYIVESGSIAISIELPDGSNKELAKFGQGEFFGEMSIFEDAPRSATCTVKESGRLLTMDQGDFFRIMVVHPFIAIKMMYRMLNRVTQRLRNTSGFLSDMVRWGETARKRAITDELTGVYNRRFLDDALKENFRRSKSEKKPFTLIMVDLDYFREINESYGHEVGDQVILEVVEVFRKSFRKRDIIARYGGDEFSVILPNTSIERAVEIAEKVRRDVEKLDLLSGREGPVQSITTSQGVANFPASAKSLEGLREAADQALYKAKDAGRNQVATPT